MKRKFLLLTVALLCSTVSWGYTSVAPEDVRAYYLYNVGNGTYWYGADYNIGSGGNTRYTGHTNSLYDATPTRVRISGGNYTFTYYVNGTEYQIRHTDNNGEAKLTGGNANFQLYSKTDGYSIEFKSDNQRRMRAENAGTCDYPKDLDNTTVHWRFYAYEEILPDLVEHNAGTCATTAEASYVSGWERVTTKAQLLQNPEKYFYAILSAVNPGVMMTTEYNDGKYRMCYKAAGNPLSSSTYDLFEIESYDGEIAIKSNITGQYYGNTSGYPWDFEASKATLNEDCKVTVTCNNGIFNLQDNWILGSDDFVGNYLGSWDNLEFTGERLAGNKGLKRAGYFLIYRIAKKDLDLTSRITNPSFEAEDITAWSCSTGSDTGRKQNSGTYAMSKGAGSYLFNTWNNGNANPVSQTLSNMPSGFYRLAAVMASDNNEMLRLKVGDDVIATSTATGAANGIEMGGTFYFAGGNMIISADANDHWYKVDDFHLTCIDGMQDLTTVSGKMNADVNTNQQNAVTTYNNNKTIDNYNAAQEAIAAAETSVAAYANAKTYFDAVEPVLETTNFYTSTAYATNYSTPNDDYDAGTLSDVDAAALSYGSRRTGNMPAILLSPWAGETLYINTWSTESEGSGDAADFANPFYEYWVADGNVLEAKKFEGTLPGLTANKFYKVTAKVRVRETNDVTKAAKSITMQVGSGEIVDVTAGKQIASSKRYVGEFSAIGQAGESGNLVLTFDVKSGSNISWLSFRDLIVTQLADDDDYAELNDAISAAEAHALGFDAAEYAPYNNVAALTALAAAKAIDQGANNTKKSVNDATTALSGATWTDNAEEQNAFYDGDFSKCTEDNTSPLDYTPAGWTASNNFRMMLKNTETYPGLEDASAHSAPMLWSAGITYGETVGYKMPLKANTVYSLRFKAAGWNNESRSGMTVSVLNASDGLAATDLGTPNRDIKGNENNTAGMTSYEKLFATGAAGDYVFHIQSGNNFVLADLELKKAAGTLSEEATSPILAGNYKSVTLTRTLTADIWNTFSVPFSFTVAGSPLEGARVMKFNSASDNIITMEDTDEVVAGDPYIVKLTFSNIVNPVFEGVTVTNPIPEAKGTGDYQIKAQLYNTPLATDGSVAYLSTDGSVKRLISGGIKGLRAIFLVPKEATAKALVVDFGDADGIMAIDKGQLIMNNDVIYNLAGQKMSKLQRGVNIVNGKKVMVK